MNDLPNGRPHSGGHATIGSDPTTSGTGRLDPRTAYDRPGMSSPRDIGPDTASGYVAQRGGRRSPPTGLGSIIGFFFGLMLVFIFAAAIAQYAVRGDRQQTGTAPPVAQDQVPAQPSPPADGNPGGSTTRDAVTP